MRHAQEKLKKDKEKVLKSIKLTKKQLIIIISAVVLLATALTVTLVLLGGREESERSVFYYGDFGYVIKDDGKVEIVSYSGSDTAVEVPTAIDGMSVTSIGAGAFLGNKMQSVKLGIFVTEIGHSAFHSCTSLAEINWSPAIKKIDAYAFYMCVALKSVDIPSGVTSVGTAAFAECLSITEAKLPESVTNVPPHLFYNCEELTTVTLGSATKTVGDFAFSGCLLLSSINVSNVVSFGAYAFEGCSALTSLTVNSLVETIGEGFLFATSSMESLTVGEGNSRYSTASGALVDLVDKCVLYMPPKSTVATYVLPEGTKSIADYAFNNCLTLNTVVLTESLESVGSFAFNLCDNLTRIVMPDTPETVNCDFPESISHVGGQAFYNTKFKKQLPKGFTVVGDGILIAFHPYLDSTGNYIDGEGVTVLTEIVDKGGYSVNEILGVNVVVPEGIKSISSAFSYSSDVVEVTLPASVSEISDYAFYHAVALQKIDMSKTSITHLPDSSLAEVVRLETIEFPSALATVGQMTFAGNSALKEVRLPESLTEV